MSGVFKAIAGALVVLIVAAVMPAKASDNPALDQAVLSIAREWAADKYLISNPAESEKKMDQLGVVADALATKYPSRAEALIWDGIITSERASMTNPISALSLAYHARDLLEKAEKIDPFTLDAGAPTSLGVLYYRVPGFPLGFGDKAKARRLLQEAVKNAPNGMDAFYFYGDFLNEQGEYPQAAAALRHMLSLPHDPNRPVWDKYRRIVAQELLEKVEKEMGH